jgi:hypothetical protein
MSNDGIPVHLRPIEPEVVTALCGRALALDRSHYIRLEVDGFMRDRTPWDARRLARALAIEHADDPLVAELFGLALQRAGLKPDLHRGQK